MHEVHPAVMCVGSMIIVHNGFHVKSHVSRLRQSLTRPGNMHLYLSYTCTTYELCQAACINESHLYKKAQRPVWRAAFGVGSPGLVHRLQVC